MSCTQASSWTVRKATVREPSLLSSLGNCTQLTMIPELLAQETSTEYNWRYLEKHIQHVKNTEEKTTGFRWNRGHIKPTVINLGDDSFSDELSPNKVVTTAVVLMKQWVRYNFVNKQHVFYMYSLRITSYVQEKIPEIKCVQTTINVETIENAVCEWNCLDNKRIAMLLP